MRLSNSKTMKNWSTFWFLLTTVIVMTAAVSFLTADSQVSISSSATLATIGDRINLKVIVKTSDAIEKIAVKPSPQQPGAGTDTSGNDENKALLPYEIVGQKELKIRKEKDYTVFEKELTVAFFNIGEYDIGPFTVELLSNNEVIETKETNTIPITVQTVLVEEDKDIKPLKEPIALKGNPFYILKYVILALVLVSLVILGVFLYKRRAKKVEPEQPLLPPLEEMELSLNKLWEQNLFGKGKIKPFFIQLTKIVKRFLERQYSFNAEDSTTYETFYFLKRKEKDAVILDSLEVILQIADLVKFAKFIPGADSPSEIRRRIDDMAQVYKRRLMLAEQKQQMAQAAKSNQAQETTTEKPAGNGETRDSKQNEQQVETDNENDL